MECSDLPKNLNSFLEEYLEKIGDDSKEIKRDLELIQQLDEVNALSLYDHRGTHLFFRKSRSLKPSCWILRRKE